MKNFQFRKWLFLCIFVVVQLYGNEVDKKDSIEIAKVTLGFFGWYISASTSENRKGTKPTFSQDNNGMTTLDITEYSQNLKKYGFSDELLKDEIESYSVCLKNLKSLKYVEFMKIGELDEYEKMKCDFGNAYRWTGGQEPCEGVELTSIERNENTFYTAKLKKFDISKDGKRYYWGNITVTLEKEKGKWKIQSIQY